MEILQNPWFLENFLTSNMKLWRIEKFILYVRHKHLQKTTKIILGKIHGRQHNFSRIFSWFSSSVPAPIQHNEQIISVYLLNSVKLGIPCVSGIYWFLSIFCGWFCCIEDLTVNDDQLIRRATKRSKKWCEKPSHPPTSDFLRSIKRWE